MLMLPTDRIFLLRREGGMLTLSSVSRMFSMLKERGASVVAFFSQRLISWLQT